MLDFTNELTRLYGKVKEEYESAPFIRVDYPKNASFINWDLTVDECIVPKVDGFIYFIFSADKELLYIGKTCRVMFALKSHLVRRTSATTRSVLDEIKELIEQSENKFIYIKTIEVYPREYSACFKPLLVKEYHPKLVKRIS